MSAPTRRGSSIPGCNPSDRARLATDRARHGGGIPRRAAGVPSEPWFLWAVVPAVIAFAIAVTVFIAAELRYRGNHRALVADAARLASCSPAGR